MKDLCKFTYEGFDSLPKPEPFHQEEEENEESADSYD